MFEIFRAHRRLYLQRVQGKSKLHLLVAMSGAKNERSRHPRSRMRAFEQACAIGVSFFFFPRLDFKNREHLLLWAGCDIFSTTSNSTATDLGVVLELLHPLKISKYYFSHILHFLTKMVIAYCILVQIYQKKYASTTL